MTVPPPPRPRLKHVCPPHPSGLDWCVVCDGAEGEMPTDCPGAPLTAQQRDEILARRLDFVGGYFIETDL